MLIQKLGRLVGLVHDVVAQAQTNQVQVESTIILFHNQKLKPGGAFKLGSSLHLRPHHQVECAVERDCLAPLLRLESSEQILRLGPNLLVTLALHLQVEMRNRQLIGHDKG